MHYDRLETRKPAVREAALFRDLRAILRTARPTAAALRMQLRGIKLDEVRCREDLAAIPLMRKSDVARLQAEDAPFGGLAPTRPARLRRDFASPGAIYEPAGWSKDWWGAARALHAAGFRKGDLVLNCFSYHLTPGGHIMESGAHALGCAVLPGGVGNTDAQVEAIHHFRPSAYCGAPDFLKMLLDRADELGRDATCIKRALVSGAALPESLRKILTARGVAVRQAYATADLGIVAYESATSDGVLAPGMVVNENVILEIVRPGSGDPLPPGEIGEVVVTRLNSDYPLLRFATGDLSSVIPGLSPCGRTNMRIRGWQGRADQTTKVRGMFVHPAQVTEIGKRHPELSRLRLVVTRSGERDELTLMAESATSAGPLKSAVETSLRDCLKLRGHVEFVDVDSLPNDGRIIADERPVN